MNVCIPTDIPRYSYDKFKVRATPLGLRYVANRLQLKSCPDDPIGQWVTMDGAGRYAFYIDDELFVCTRYSCRTSTYVSLTSTSKCFIAYNKHVATTSKSYVDQDNVRRWFYHE